MTLIKGFTIALSCIAYLSTSKLFVQVYVVTRTVINAINDKPQAFDVLLLTLSKLNHEMSLSYMTLVWHWTFQSASPEIFCETTGKDCHEFGPKPDWGNGYMYVAQDRHHNLDSVFRQTESSFVYFDDMKVNIIFSKDQIIESYALFTRGDNWLQLAAT